MLSRIRSIGLGTWILVFGIMAATLLDWDRFKQGVAMVKGLAADFGTVQKQVLTHDLALKDIEERLRRVEDSRSTLLPQMYDRFGRAEQRLDDIDGRLDDMDDRLDHIERNHR